ncbi:MAG: hypothetical protein K6G81_11425 [Lachnospiraceae bacterium]|nr:hypothetical protein [Lachnospiraceae bacterium]
MKETKDIPDILHEKMLGADKHIIIGNSGENPDVDRYGIEIGIQKELRDYLINDNTKCIFNIRSGVEDGKLFSPDGTVLRRKR